MKSLDSANVDGYIECKPTEESNENKYYLIFASTEKSREVLEKYIEP